MKYYICEDSNGKFLLRSTRGCDKYDYDPERTKVNEITREDAITMRVMDDIQAYEHHPSGSFVPCYPDEEWS